MVQMERRPGHRYIGEVLELCGLDPERDKYEFNPVYQARAGGA
jgi:hypothetical protein